MKADSATLTDKLSINSYKTIKKHAKCGDLICVYPVIFGGFGLLEGQDKTSRCGDIVYSRFID